MTIFSSEKPENSEKTMILSKPRLIANQRKLINIYSVINNKCSSQAIFRNNLNLPHLPVPSVAQTTEKYLLSVTPFLNNEELNKTKQLLEKFKLETEILQKHLVHRAKNTENWLADWWLTCAYLEYRDPVVVYSSPGLVFPCENFENENDRLAYTAKMILGAVDYKLQIDNDNIPLDKMGKDPLDMNQYKKIFGTCRIPQDKRDGLEFNHDSRHIVIARNNNYFKLQVVNSQGKVPSVSQLVSQLKYILKSSQEVDPPVGILTADKRDNWAKSYITLKQVCPSNAKSVEEIQKSLFLVCLDNPMPEYDGNRRSLGSKQFIHGGGSRGNSANRWFDKTIQFIIGQDGTVGLTYEHSPSEGQPIAVMTDYIVEFIKKDVNLPDTKLEMVPIKLPFEINNAVLKDIHAANTTVDDMVANLDTDSFKFEDFGKDFVKSQKLSPDSFIQIAMQYAFYKIHRVPGAHYESAATRKYIHGRTETIRSCSIESVAFAKTMLQSKSDSDKVAALKSAINSHKKYSIDAVNGFGVDRHLLGLKQVALEKKIPLPELYQDASYARSSHMRLSTSQVATKCDGFMVYAPLTSDGYGCCYNPRPNDINFGVSAFTSNQETSATIYRETLTSCLKEMHDILARSQMSKL
ncbi:unnamed protein product [Brassicogethes aeneus]|uniref:Choline/carnitine acyltransferase domain-containing protein n=1 Tax=Brassicogethes aeneus TaxID=1431903 RepID=A0A9P0B858_BRAAE|nr:unnamed protein product [Brassicogethes aeneus]